MCLAQEDKGNFEKDVGLIVGRLQRNTTHRHRLILSLSKDARSSRSWLAVRRAHQAHHERLGMNLAIVLASIVGVLTVTAYTAMMW